MLSSLMCVCVCVWWGGRGTGLPWEHERDGCWNRPGYRKNWTIFFEDSGLTQCVIYQKDGRLWVRQIWALGPSLLIFFFFCSNTVVSCVKNSSYRFSGVTQVFCVLPLFPSLKLRELYYSTGNRSILRVKPALKKQLKQPGGVGRSRINLGGCYLGLLTFLTIGLFCPQISTSNQPNWGEWL